MDKYEMLRRVSRTFALSIEQLPGILRDAITLAYLLLRVSDCLEDCDGIPVPEKPELLRLWATILENGQPVETLLKRIAHLDGLHDDEIRVAQNADYLLKQYERLPQELRNIITPHVCRTSLGMASWQEHGPFVDDEAEMDDYMFYVAGVVGYLLTDVLAWYSPLFERLKNKMMPLAREYGLGLQTVNIIRGMRKDYERGWVYIPRSYYEPLGLTRDSLFLPENLNLSMRVVAMLADKAEKHLANGLEYLLSIPIWLHAIRLSCMWPLLFAVRTLALSRLNKQVILDEVKMSRNQVKEIVLKTRFMGWSNQWLETYYQQLSKPFQPENVI
ncbi:MAG: squalene/phytoene synthase family protein [Anaerolineae bacterium]|nr:squalene/phytoene synthase family protein [Anaerolineae bacterium]